MMEMRDVLTAEVAEKHDIILSLRSDIQRLEEQCCQVDKHAQFKDDIIKELRKEIKQLKQQVRRIFFIIPPEFLIMLLLSRPRVYENSLTFRQAKAVRLAVPLMFPEICLKETELGTTLRAICYP